ncbi:MAG: DUF1778 domain-containing protein [Propionibacteriaceae bacterium]|nr:DUF1778 domain-containing protein [Propionibacteriaceae bacterium]
MTVPTRKVGRIGLRVTARQEQVLKWAADATEHTLSDFVLDSAMAEAQQVLAARRWFMLDDDQYAEFDRLSQESLPSVNKLAKLLASE